MILASCVGSESKYDKALKNFENDSLKFQAVKFLIENIDDHHGVVISYRDDNDNVVDDELKSYIGENTNVFLDSIGAIIMVEELMDSVVMSSDYLISDVENAFKFYENNPLGLKVDQDVFHNYILPYRIGVEELNDWRAYFNKRYTKHLQSFNRSYEMRSLLQVINNEKNPWQNIYV